jgi:hypothetical protein
MHTGGESNTERKEPMSPITKPPTPLDELDYPTYAWFPVAETDWHRDLMFNLIQILSTF